MVSGRVYDPPTVAELVAMTDAERLLLRIRHEIEELRLVALAKIKLFHEREAARRRESS